MQVRLFSEDRGQSGECVSLNAATANPTRVPVSDLMILGRLTQFAAITSTCGGKRLNPNHIAGATGFEGGFALRCSRPLATR